jgi:hypothetical protein
MPKLICPRKAFSVDQARHWHRLHVLDYMGQTLDTECQGELPW